MTTECSMELKKGKEKLHLTIKSDDFSTDMDFIRTLWRYTDIDKVTYTVVKK